MTDSIYAVYDENGLISNIVMWDGQNEWTPPEGTTAVKINESGAGIGWTYKDGVFTPPPAPEIPKEELIAHAEQQKSNLITEASQTIPTLQDAVDLEMATDDEKTQLLEWKKYRILLNRIDTALAPDIEWPEKPAL